MKSNPLLSIDGIPAKTNTGDYLIDKDLYSVYEFACLYKNTTTDEIENLIKKGDIKGIFDGETKTLKIPKKDFVVAVNYFNWVWRNRK